MGIDAVNRQSQDLRQFLILMINQANARSKAGRFFYLATLYCRRKIF